MVTDYETLGFARFPHDPGIAAWAKATLPYAHAALNDPEMRQQWLVCEGTWFVGVDALPNDPDGRIGGVPLTGAVMSFIRDHLPQMQPLHRAQLSVTFPGYPKPRGTESEAAFRYRLKRDAAHVDGVRALGPDRRRYLVEPHGYILGLPLNAACPNASPLVAWAGSHKIMARAFQSAFQGHDPESWAQVDVTEIYAAARRDVFETCQRVELPADPGQAILLHRLTLHGVAPWADDKGHTQRMIAYFRPELADMSHWPDCAV